MKKDFPILFYFSLVEFTVVLVIVMVISGLALGRVGKIPVSASLDKTTRELERFFAQTSRLAAVSGKTVRICYDPEERLFSIPEEREDGDNGQFFLKSNETFLTETFRNYFLSEEIAVRFDEEDRAVRKTFFQCFPDGGVSGPSIHFSMDGQKLSLKPSPLTGILIKSEVAGDWTQ